jgi:lysozyme family protein
MAIDIVGDILKREGGFVDNPMDRGGATNFGVTAHTFRWWRNDPNADIRTLKEPEAREILTAIFIDRPKISQLPPELVPFMSDWAVHSGPFLAIEHLQRALKVTVDGTIGPETLAAAQKANKLDLLRLLIASRIKMIGRIVAKSPQQSAFLIGWLERVLGFLC